ncbi:MAG: hypothetical protein EPN24_06055 [Candidatus Methanoperedens sp.]|nr:MAG: hypothetical protein EPN24_06055 [Candidatus Methanoperedens sp.]
MSTERDIIIERLEQKLAAKDREFEQILEMNKSLRDSVLEQQNARSDNETQTEERINRFERRLVELNSAYEGVMKELLDQKSIIQELKPKKIGREEPGAKFEMRNKDELMSSTYKMHDKQKEEAKPKEDVKQPEKPKPKGEYIVADNYVPKDKRMQQVIIEAEDKAEDKTKLSDKTEQKPVFNKPILKRSERAGEGVEIYENPKRGR